MTEANMNVENGAGRQRKVRVDYPSNSQKARQQDTPEERVKRDKVVEGAVVQKKPSLGKRVFHDFVAEDSHSVVQYVVMEVLLPAAKSTISDVVSQGIERLLYGDSRPRRSERSGYTNYSARAVRSSAPLVDTRPPLSRQARTRHQFEELMFETLGDAEDVLDTMRELLDRYEVVTVSDLYDLCDITSDFTDNKWGWYNLRDAGVRRIRGGYSLSLPRTESIP
jgi:hypothetical protein